MKARNLATQERPVTQKFYERNEILYIATADRKLGVALQVALLLSLVM